jgi:hypothetical protein
MQAGDGRGDGGKGEEAHSTQGRESGELEGGEGEGEGEDEGEGQGEGEWEWWQIQVGSGVGSSPLGVLLLTASRMEDFRSGGYEENLVDHLGALAEPLEEPQLATITLAGAEVTRVWEERCNALEAAGVLEAEWSTPRAGEELSELGKEALVALRALHEVLSAVGVTPLQLQQAAALT